MINKYFCYYCITFFLSLLVCSCSALDTPDKVLLKFYQYINEGEYSKANELNSKDAKQFYEGGSMVYAGGFNKWANEESKSGKIKEVKVVDSQVRGEGATLRYKVIYTDAAVKVGETLLTKEDGSWRMGTVEDKTFEAISSNRDAILCDLNNIGADAYQWKIRPSSMGGGNGAYDNSAGGSAYAINLNGEWGVNNPYATYRITSESASAITFEGVSKTFTATATFGGMSKTFSSTVILTFDASGRGDTPTYTGQFK